MIKKLNKHINILRTRVNNRQEENRLKAVKSQRLQSVYKAIIDARQSDFTSVDLTIFDECEKYRNKLLSSDETVSYEVFNSAKTSTVSQICKKAASSKKWCALIYSLVSSSGANNVFEVGTNLGVSGVYILNALKDNASSMFVSLEGLPKLCEISGNEFQRICNNRKFKIWQGLYQDTFDSALKSVSEIDCSFIDGNHQYGPTVDYFHKIQSKSTSNSLLIFDDINWSEGMQRAWREIRNDASVALTIDLYEIGIVILDSNYNGPSQHFNFHYSY